MWCTVHSAFIVDILSALHGSDTSLDLSLRVRQVMEVNGCGGGRCIDRT